MSEEENCGNCRFWLGDPSHLNSGVCRIRSPVVVASGNYNISTAYPETGSMAWCGEWQSTTKYVVEPPAEPPAPSNDVNEILALLRHRRGAYMHGSPSWVMVDYCITDILDWIKEE
jgi:hypothetical protein